MSEYDMVQASQNSPAVNQRGIINDATAGAVPPPPAYPGHGGATAASGPGLLRTKISLGGRKPAVIMPFTLMKPELPAPSPINGSMNLLTYYGLDHAWNKFCAPNKKLKEELSAFLPHLPGNIDTPGTQDNSSLRSLIEKPPICGKEILPLSTSALAGFKLQPGPIPEAYRVFAGGYAPSRPSQVATTVGDEKSGRHSRRKHKRKHERSGRGSEDRPTDAGLREERTHGLGASSNVAGVSAGADSGVPSAAPSAEVEEGRKAKGDEGGVTEKKKKKKKDKKRKRSRSPEHASSGVGSANPPSASAYSTTDFDF